jgi:hypothetical protein
MFIDSLMPQGPGFIESFTIHYKRLFFFLQLLLHLLLRVDNKSYLHKLEFEMESLYKRMARGSYGLPKVL